MSTPIQMTPHHREIKHNPATSAQARLTTAERRAARKRWPNLPVSALASLALLIERYGFSITGGDLSWIERGWYVTHAALLALASRRNCSGIEVRAMTELCDPKSNRWVFCATVFPTRNSKGFSGYGDADPTNVGEAVHGAELRIAETRAVNRALRKAYGVGLCSLEELSSAHPPQEPAQMRRASRSPGSSQLEVVTTPLLRDQLRQLIRQERLDPDLVKKYALTYLGVSSLREASRDRVGEFLAHLRNRLFQDRDGFLAELMKLVPTEGVKVA